MITYTTPLIPLDEFDDYKPGMSLETIGQVHEWLTDTYQPHGIRKTVHTTGVQFTLTGEAANLAPLAALYGQTV